MRIHILKLMLFIPMLLIISACTDANKETIQNATDKINIGKDFQALLDKKPGSFQKLTQPNLQELLDYIMKRMDTSLIPMEEKEAITLASDKIRIWEAKGNGFNDEVIAGLIELHNALVTSTIFVRQQEGGVILEEESWLGWCFGRFMECMAGAGSDPVAISGCALTFAACGGLCFEGGTMVTGGEDEVPPCTAPCQQVKLVVSNPFVTINPAGQDCANLPILSAIKAAFIADVTNRVAYDWRDDPADTCGDCRCVAEGDGVVTATDRQRFPASATLNGCNLTGSVSIKMEKSRRSGECMPN